MKTQPAKAAARCPAPSRQPPLRRTCLALLIGACFGPALAQPTLPQVVNGQATFARQGNVFSITNTPNAIINWQSFSVNPGELTRFIQQSAGSSVLNRITGQDPSRILGALQSNGRVFLVNPNGVLFGRDARVDVNGLVASSLAISNGDFLAGRQRFAADGGAAGAVANQGVITTPAGGQVFLLAPQVDNSGIINAPNGEVVLAAGRSVQLADAANPALQVGLSAPADQAVNLGQVIAQGGRIGIFGALVNQRGRLSADSAVLGENGKIVLKSSGTTLLEAGSRTSATGAGRGGRIELLGRRVGLTGDAGVDASGALGGGSILVGGDYRGANAAVMNAEQSYLGAGATLKADATARGDGGKVVVWSDGATRVLGNISARGGAHGGDGGFVETSGHYLDMQGNVDTTAARGRTGQLLLDPSNIYVAVDGATATGAGMAPTGAGNASNSGNVFSETSSSADSLLTTGALVELLNGSNVTVTTSNPNAGGAGFIKVVSPVAWGSGRALTLDAAAGISLDAGIDGGSGALTLLSAAGDITQSVALKVGALTARAPGGSVMLNFADNQIGGPVTLDASLNAVLAAGGGGALDIASASVGGDLSVIAGGGPLRVSGNVTSNGGIVRLFADNIDLLGSIAVGTGSVTLQPISPTQQIHVGVGAADAAGTLGLSEAELRRISTSGFLTVAPSGADVTGNLTVVGNLDLSSTLNAGSVNGNLLLGVNEGMGNLTINAGAQVVVPGKLELSTQTFDGYTITNAGSLKATEVHLSSGKMVLEGGVIDAPVVSLSTQNAIDLGSSTDSQLATLELSGAELARLNNNTDLRIEVFLNSSGGMVISAPLRLPANLTLAAPAVIDARAALSVGGVFRLDQGSWMQNNANLPAFSAGDFQINQGAASFLRVKGGTGASGGGSPYQIADVYGLQGIASLDMANEYVLAANIAAAGTVNWNGGEGFAPIVDGQGLGFSGVLDGAGHSISGLTINLPAGRGGNGSSVGMFGVLSGGTVKNLSLLGGSVKGVSKVGALAGYVNSGSILNVSSDVSVSGDLTIGGLVGSNNGSIVGSRASGAVTGNGESIGGLVGYNDGSGTISASAAFGGVGGARRVGGLVGLNAGLIQDAFALGAVSGVANPDYMSENIGGLVGENATGGSGSGSIVNVYSAGAVRAAGFANVGGLVGLNNVSLSNGYWNTSTSGQAVGLGADNSSGSSATGLTEAQSMQQASFAGFEFGGSAPVWRLYEGRTGPLLKALLTPLAADVSATARREYDGSQSHFAGSIGYTGLTGGDTGADGALDYTTAARNVGTYALDGLWSTKYDITYTGNTSLTIDPRALTVGIGGSKVYDGSTGFTGAVYTINRLIDGDNVTVGGSATFLDKNAGTGKAVSAEVSLSGADIGNYSFGSGASGFADITKATVGIATLTGVNKVYDGVTAASVSGTLSGVLGSDSVTLVAGASNFADKNVGTGKSIGMSGATLGGGDAGNYALANSAGGATADISARTLNLNYSAGNKVYDGNVNASVSSSDDRVAGDVFGVSQSASFADKNAGANKKVTLASVALSGADAGNYLLNYSPVLQASISQANLSLAGVSVANRVYDGTLQASVSGATLGGVIGQDQVVVSGGQGSFSDKNVGVGKLVKATGFVLEGVDAGNYALASLSADASADITARTLQLRYTAAAKVYDGSTVASLSGVADDRVAGDVLDISQRANFVDKNVGVAKAVTLSDVALGGADGGNYVVAVAGPLFASITPARLGLSGVSVASRAYDGGTDALVRASLDGVVGGDAVSLFGGAGRFDDKNVGVGKNVAISGFRLGGADAGNYQFVPGGLSATADITQKALASWVGAAGGLWSEARNWDGGAVPDGANVLDVNLTGSGVVNYNAGAGATSIRNLNGGQGLSVSGGSLTLGYAATDRSLLSGAPGLNISGGNLVLRGALTVDDYAQSGGVVGGGGGLNVRRSFSQSAGNLGVDGALAIVQASGDLAFSNLSAASVSLFAEAGRISQSGPVVSANLVARAQNGVALSNAGNRVGGFSASNSGAGGIALTNVSKPGTLVLGTLSSGAGDIVIDNTGGIESHAINANGGNVSLTAHSPIQVEGAISGADIDLSASTDIVLGDGARLAALSDVSMSAGTGIALQGAARVNAGGNIALAAGSGVTLDGTSSLTASAGSIHIATASGSIVAGGGASISGASVLLSAPQGAVVAPGSVFAGGAVPVVESGTGATPVQVAPLTQALNTTINLINTSSSGGLDPAPAQMPPLGTVASEPESANDKGGVARVIDDARSTSNEQGVEKNDGIKKTFCN